jgi:hypothetical protein
MTLGISTRRYALRLAGVIAALAIAMAAISSAAQADLWIGKLPGKTWTCGSCAVGTLHGLFAHVLEGPSAICVGPVQYSGGWVFPYGWDCGGSSVDWEFAAINAAHGTDNPNSSEDKFEASSW